jgi:molecular chaperone Hsp33
MGGSILPSELFLPSEPHPRADDLVQPFRIDPFALRGRLVRLGPTIDRILSQHDYPEPVAAILGEAITLAVVLAGMLKYDGVFTLQTKSDGPVRLIVADVSTDGAVRGYAQYDRDRLAQVPVRSLGAPAISPSVPELIGAGYIAFTVDQGEHTERYQGIVAVTGATLADCAQHYFRQSEQIQAGIKLAVARSGEGGAWRAGGLMLQRVPPEGGYRLIADDVEDGWRRAMVLMSSATPVELVDPELSPRRLLFRLFHEEGVRVFRTQPVEARCRCSRERIGRILRSFPQVDIDELRQDPVTTVTCEFCNTCYKFTPDDLAPGAPHRHSSC